jgi:hypothetical protein
MIVDGGIERVLPKVYLHWMVTDIPANTVEKGNEVMEYVTPFSIEIDAEGKILKDAQQSSHLMLLLVFKQPGAIIVEETQAGCSPDIAGPTQLGDTDEYSAGRIHDYRDLATKYGLELVAGNFLQVPWSGFHTQQMLCLFTKCTRQAFPFPMSGINDLPECEPDMTITDMTIIGPKADKRDEYIKWRSLASLDSVQSGIQNLFPTHSTGKVADFTVSEGSFGAPIGSDNQAETLDGIVDVSFLEYPNAEKTIELFANLLQWVPGANPEFFSTVAGGGPLKIILSRPEDQDFDFMTVLKTPEMLMDLLIVKTTEGKEALHHAMREKRSRGSGTARTPSLPSSLTWTSRFSKPIQQAPSTTTPQTTTSSRWCTRARPTGRPSRGRSARMPTSASSATPSPASCVPPCPVCRGPSTGDPSSKWHLPWLQQKMIGIKLN